MKDVRILDLSRVLAGPWAVQQLADQGASVIKVEPPGGDDTRRFGPFVEGHSTYFYACNRNKRSIEVNLKTSRGKHILARLLQWADVVVENFRPQAMSSLNLDPKEILKTHPELVWVSIRGFGESVEEHKYRPGYDLLLQCEGGAAAITGDENTPPFKHGNSTADLTTGFNVVQAILLGLLHHSKTGIGQQIVVNMLQTQVSCLTYHTTRWSIAGEAAEKRGNSHAGLVPYDLYPCIDGWLCIAVGTDAMWARLCDALSIDAPISWKTNKGRLTHRDAIQEVLQSRTKQWKREDLSTLLRTFDIPAGPVLTPEQALDHPAAQHIEVSHDDLGTIPLVGPIVNTMTTRIHHSCPPDLNAHRAEILEEIGYATDFPITSG